MNHIELTAIGRSGHAVLSHLHRLPVSAIRLYEPLDLKAASRPKTRDEIEDRVRIALAAPAAEMHYASLPTTHLSDEREEVLHAIDLAEKIDPHRPVDVLEEQLDHTLACLRSPRVWHAVKYLGGALLRSARGEMEGARVERVICEGFDDLAGTDFSKPAHPRRLHIDRGERR
jgi:hypothetical protein